MVNKIITTYSSETKNSDGRLEPRFYYNQSLLKKTFDKFGYKEIGNFANLKSGSTPEHHGEKKNDKNCYFVKSADVKRYNLNFSTISFVSSETHESRNKIKIIPNDILLSSTGTLGFACLVPQTLKEGSTNQNIIRIRFKDENSTNFNPYFLLAFLNSQFGQIEIETLLTLTGQKYINMENFEKYKIPKIDEKTIESVGLKLKKAQNNEAESFLLLEKAKKIFYQNLNVDFSKLKKELFYSVNTDDFIESDLWIPKYSCPLYINVKKSIQEKWKVTTLGTISTIKKGSEVGSDNYNLYLGKRDDDVAFIRTSDLVNYEADQFPDFFIPKEIHNELNQDIKTGDILFTKDGKIGMTAMITESDKVIISSGISRIRLKIEAKKQGLTSEYIFLVLSLKETGLYPAIRRTVIASTLPHLREERLKEIEIPILDKNSIDEITRLTKKAFELKNEKKKMIKDAQKEIDSYLNFNFIK